MLTGPKLKHFAVEVFALSYEDLDSDAWVESVLEGVVDRLQFRLVSLHTKHFELGVTGVAIVTESHVVIHTWPEFGYLHLDMLTCVPHERDDLREAIQELTRADVSVVDLSSYMIPREQVIPDKHPTPPDRVQRVREKMMPLWDVP